MEECSLDLILARDRPFGFLVVGGAVFSNSLKLYFFRQSECVSFCNHKVFSQVLLGPICMFNFSFIK